MTEVEVLNEEQPIDESIVNEVADKVLEAERELISRKASDNECVEKLFDVVMESIDALEETK